jgi:hypothetical protein
VEEGKEEEEKKLKCKPVKKWSRALEVPARGLVSVLWLPTAIITGKVR